MRHIEFDPNSTYDTAILIKDSQLIERELLRYYVGPLKAHGISGDKLIAFSLDYGLNNKCTMTDARKYAVTLLKALGNLKVKHLLVCDAQYFKALTKLTKTEVHYGNVMQCTIPGYEDIKIILAPNYKAMYYNPALQIKLDLALLTLTKSINGVFTKIGTSIVHSAKFPDTEWKIKEVLDSLHNYDMLTCDIEAFSLEVNKAGIGSIAFAWNEHEGVSFLVDWQESPYMDNPSNTFYGRQIQNLPIKQLLLDFFNNYKGTLIYHNASYDIKILIYELYMKKGFFNMRGMIKGIKVMSKNIHDTKLITYLATNSTRGNKLGLKENAHEFAGNYAEENVEDIRLIPKDKLLTYNLKDCLSTWYVFNKNYPKMMNDKQYTVYNDIYLGSIPVILQKELVGMPLNKATVRNARLEMTKVFVKSEEGLRNSPIIKAFTVQLQKEECLKKNLLLKVKVKPLEDFHNIQFNSSSTTHLRKLFYEYLGYDVIDKTKTGLPATGAKTINKLLHKSKDPEHTLIMQYLIDKASVDIILNTFIEAFLTKSIDKADDRSYLHGNFNLGGTVSGRMSSSKPNLQNIPSTGTKYAKAIKKCFQAPSGWLLVGADFSSLEDRISALTTKDPNKLKVYTDGYDGHCLRAYSYFGSQMDKIGTSVQSINSIAQRYPALRQHSKGPTFLLTYGGTSHGLVNTIGINQKEALEIEKKYHELYVVSDEWVQTRIDKAVVDGYVTCAFGLRLRTPILEQTLLNKKVTPYEAKSEARTAGNALGQSYGMLNNRAGIEFQERVFDSSYELDILPIAHIHDSQYFLIRNNIGCLHWFNKNLVECMEWQKLPEIQHPTVKLGGEVEVFYPTWAESHTIPNNATKQQILKICKESK